MHDTNHYPKILTRFLFFCSLIVGVPVILISNTAKEWGTTIAPDIYISNAVSGSDLAPLTILIPDEANCQDQIITIAEDQQAIISIPLDNLQGTVYDSIQWYLDGTAIPGGTTEQITVDQAGYYTIAAYNTSAKDDGCVLQPPCGVIIRHAVTDTDPSCNCTDQNAFILEGQEVVLNIPIDTLLFAGYDSLQWYRDNHPIAGENADSLVTSQVGFYTIKAFDSSLPDPGSCYSSSECGILILYQNPPCPACDEQTVFLCKGEEIALSIPIANLNNIPDYDSLQWYQDGNPVAGGNTSDLTVDQQGYYTFEVFKSGAQAFSRCDMSTQCGFRVIDHANLTASYTEFLDRCPGIAVEGAVGFNDTRTFPFKYSLITPTSEGTITLDTNGRFSYLPNDFDCVMDQFVYQVCYDESGCCDTATTVISMEDVVQPTLINIPADITLSADEQPKDPPFVSSFDNCVQVLVAFDESDNQADEGCGRYSYVVDRTWTATDGCGNQNIDTQQIFIEDFTAPDIYKIYTLPNGKKLIAGVMEDVNENWKAINLPINFSAPPLIFTQVINQNNPSTTTICRTRNITNSQFELKLQQQQANSVPLNRDKVAWIALEESSQTNDYLFDAQATTLDHTLKTVNYAVGFSGIPALFSSITTTIDQEAATIHSNNRLTSSVDLQIMEETSADSDINHGSEQSSVLAIEHGINLTDIDGNIFGETGSAFLNGTPQSISLQHEYVNPVVILSPASGNSSEPLVTVVTETNTNSITLQLTEWDYQDQVFGGQSIDYIVVEGSVPLDGSFLCEKTVDTSQVNKDMVVVDNVDNNVTLQYSENRTYSGASILVHQTWSATDDCNNTTSYTRSVECEGVSLKVKAYLLGALISNDNDGLMRDDLRKAGFLPLEEPYSDFEDFEHVGNGGGETITEEMLAVTGDSAIVDWVFIELRSEDDINKVVATASAVICRNGIVLNPFGDDVITFSNVTIGNYYVTIRHRNHLCAVTLNPVTFTPSVIPFVDYSDPFTPLRGNHPTANVFGKMALWGGDLNGDKRVIYQGPNNDIWELFLEVLTDPNNTSYLANYIDYGYLRTDFDLDVRAIYQGPNNDRANLLFSTILVHPNNEAKFPNFIITTNSGL